MVDDYLIKFKIVNETSLDFYRYLANMYHCNWVSWLPEKLPAKGENLFICEYIRGHPSCSFDLQYNVVINELEYVIQFKFGLTNYNFNLTDNNKNSKWFTGTLISNSRAKLPVELVKIDRTTHNQVLTFLVRPTPQGKSFIKRLKMEILKSLESRIGDSSNKNSTHSEDQIRSANSDYFKSLYWNVKNIDWKTRLRKSHRSIMIRIVNLTKRCMCLAIPIQTDENSNDITMLEEGFWVEFPSEQIPPLCGTEFGCKSGGYFNGTRGRCIYKMAGEPGHFVFWWEQAPMGGSRAGGAHSNHLYSVVTHVESLNESTAIFHITHSNTPPIIATQARALPATDIKSPYNISPDILSKGVLLTPIFLQYIKNSFVSPIFGSFQQDKKEDHNSEINLFSPRTFFSRIRTGIRSTSDTKIPSDSCLYLEWMIGNEKFAKLFHPDERIRINSSIVGGLDDTQLIMTSQLVLKRFETLESKYKYIQQSLALDGETIVNNYPLGFESNEEKSINIRSNITEAELLETVLMCFNSLCHGLQPIISREMRAKFGDHWVEVSKLPTRHIWIRDSEKRIDLEGILYIITVYWMEVFESIFEDIESLQVFQTASIYWANQELHHFHSQFVWELVTKSLDLLKKLKATAAAKHVYFIQQRLLEDSGPNWIN